jgi:hypothetical protein
VARPGGYLRGGSIIRGCAGYVSEHEPDPRGKVEFRKRKLSFADIERRRRQKKLAKTRDKLAKLK